jgi:hypothetical protein
VNHGAKNQDNDNGAEGSLWASAFGSSGNCVRVGRGLSDRGKRSHRQT